MRGRPFLGNMPCRHRSRRAGPAAGRARIDHAACCQGVDRLLDIDMRPRACGVEDRPLLRRSRRFDGGAQRHMCEASHPDRGLSLRTRRGGVPDHRPRMHGLQRASLRLRRHGALRADGLVLPARAEHDLRQARLAGPHCVSSRICDGLQLCFFLIPN